MNSPTILGIKLEECRDTPPATAVDEVGCPLVTVAGELVPLNTTALFISGITTSMIWMAPVIVGIVGVGAYYLRTHKD